MKTVRDREIYYVKQAAALGPQEPLDAEAAASAATASAARLPWLSVRARGDGEQPYIRGRTRRPLRARLAANASLAAAVRAWRSCQSRRQAALLAAAAATTSRQEAGCQGLRSKDPAQAQGHHRCVRISVHFYIFFSFFNGWVGVEFRGYFETGSNSVWLKCPESLG